MSSIRVGVVVLFGNDWLGGINYFNNLINAVLTLPNNRINFILFTGHKVDQTQFNAFPTIQVIKSKIFDPYSLPWLCRRVLQKLLNYDILLEYLLKKNQIHVLSHSGVIGSNSSIPSLSWIQDFQHLHLPTFFSSKEICKRNSIFESYVRWSSIILLSSQDAFDDLQKFNPKGIEKAKVLNFVVNPKSVAGKTTALEDLQNKYQFSGRFFLLPNQFWAHKNHRVVIDAIVELTTRSIPVLVFATGNTKDNRNPNFFLEIEGYIRQLGVVDKFRILGIISQQDLYGLMRYADAVINPSFFEGWSTIVEEAKTLNKKIILSDINVHKEQAPQNGYYFHPDNALELADTMESIITSDGPQNVYKDYAPEALENFRRYGEDYHQLVMELTSRE